VKSENVYYGHIIPAATRRLPPLDINAGAAQAALLAVKYAISYGWHSLILEGDFSSSLSPSTKLNTSPIGLLLLS
jgi:hypothetical protein